MSNLSVYSKEFVYQLNSYKKDQKIISGFLEEIGKQVPIKRHQEVVQSNIRKQLSAFDALKKYPLVVLFDAFSIAHPYPFNLLILTTNSTIDRIVNRNQINRETIVEHEFVGFVALQNDYAHTYIRPETFADKINEWVDPVEVDFEEDKAFSRKYYALTTDEAQFRSQVSPAFLAAIAHYDGLEIEIINNLMLLRTKTRISQESGFKMVNVMARLCNGEN